MNKYFVPDITELRIGYECEISHYGEEFFPIAGGIQIYHFSEIANEEAEVRTKLLDIKDIQSEEWIMTHSLPENRFKVFNKGKYELRWWEDEYLEIYEAIFKVAFSFTQSDEKTEYSCIFEGYCKSINELRDAQKLLKII